MDTAKVDDNIHVRGRNFHCSLCDIKITSEKAVQDHLKGKKHVRLLDLRKCRQKQAEHSVFVGGLHKLMSELVLTDHFMQYGSVSKVIIDKDKGQYAIVEFSDKESVSKAAKQEKQVLQGCKITVRPREHKPFAVHSKGPKGGCAGQSSTSPQSQRYGIVPAELQKAIVLRLTPVENISDQMKELVTLLELPPSGVKLRYLICSLLQEVFKEFFPSCQVFPFGSSVNGFGVLGCDLDLHLEPDAGSFTYQFAKLPEETAADVQEKEEPMEDQTDEDAEQKEDMEIDLDIASAKDIMELVCKVLRQCVPSCQNIRAILHARRPVVKFQHKESKLYCDISMNNRLAMRNTELLHFYSSLDCRVRPLVYTIRHWAKVRQLAGNPGAGPRLTNYALSLMVVYYLQTRSPLILPTVEQLREGKETSTADVIEGWECSFSRDTKDTANTEELVDLLREFFHFYSTFDFTTSVICLTTGTTVPISTFTPPESPVHKGQVFRLSAINIQDPFELSHNVAFNVNEKVVQNLVKEMKKTYTLCLCNKFKKKPASSSSVDEGVWGLSVLFDPASYGNSSAGRSGRSASTSTEGSVPGDDSSQYSIMINMKASQLSEAFVKAHNTTDSLRMAWCQATAVLIKRILCDVLKFQCEERTSDKEEAALNSKTLAKEDDARSPEMEKDDKSENDRLIPCSEKTSTGEDIDSELKKSNLGDHGEASTTTRKHLLVEDEEEDGGLARKRPRLTEDGPEGSDLSLIKEVFTVCGNIESRNETVDTVDKTSLEMQSRTDGLECHPGDQELKVRQVDEVPQSGPGGSDDQQPGEEDQTHLICSTNHQVWMGRRKVRRHLNQTDPQQATVSPDKKTASSLEDRLNIETLVTNQIISQDTENLSVQPLTKFKVLLKKSQETGSGSIVVILQPLEGHVHFKALFQFLQTFLVKMTDQNLL